MHSGKLKNSAFWKASLPSRAPCSVGLWYGVSLLAKVTIRFIYRSQGSHISQVASLSSAYQPPSDIVTSMGGMTIGNGVSRNQLDVSKTPITCPYLTQKPTIQFAVLSCQNFPAGLIIYLVKLTA